MFFQVVLCLFTVHQSTTNLRSVRYDDNFCIAVFSAHKNIKTKLAVPRI